MCVLSGSSSVRIGWGWCMCVLGGRCCMCVSMLQAVASATGPLFHPLPFSTPNPLRSSVIPLVHIKGRASPLLPPTPLSAANLGHVSSDGMSSPTFIMRLLYNGIC